jgi:hypothetical protein
VAGQREPALIREDLRDWRLLIAGKYLKGGEVEVLGQDGATRLTVLSRTA